MPWLPRKLFLRLAKGKRLPPVAGKTGVWRRSQRLINHEDLGLLRVRTACGHGAGRFEFRVHRFAHDARFGPELGNSGVQVWCYDAPTYLSVAAYARDPWFGICLGGGAYLPATAKLGADACSGG